MPLALTGILFLGALPITIVDRIQEAALNCDLSPLLDDVIHGDSPNLEYNIYFQVFTLPEFLPEKGYLLEFEKNIKPNFQV